MSRRPARNLIILGCFALIVAGCSAVSHIKALQPTTAKRTLTITLPQAAWYKGEFQRGIDIDWYAYKGEDVSTAAAATVSYIASLHANAISVSFPFFLTGSRSGSVHATGATPTPFELATLINDAHRYGMYVSLRPLMDEKSLGYSRTNWKPADPAAFFRAYGRFLVPYAQIAQDTGVQEFIVGAELRQFEFSPRWAALDALIRTHYSGTLACSDNWDHLVAQGARACGTQTQTVDAYHPASTSNYLATWRAWDRTLPSGIVQTEVGIAATAPAAQKPWMTHWPGAPLDTRLQARWFASACQAATREHLGGVYFWSVGVDTTQPDGPTLSDQSAWAGSPAAAAISACYKGIGH